MAGPLLVLFFVLAFSFSAAKVSASSCQKIGNTTFCDDGTSYQQIGNTVFGSDGSSYQRIGNTTFGNDGTSYQQIGNTTFSSDGTSYQRIGNSTFGSDGSSYQSIGNTTYGSGNTYSSCPINSSANSSGGCSCNYGYSVNSTKTACVYTGTYNYTAPTTSSCPLNSYSNGTSCTCNYGYSVSGGSCVPITQVCQNKYGYNSYGSGTSCYCSTGYQWNSTQTSCVATTYTAPSSVTTPPSSTGGGSCSSFGTGSEVHGSLCYCSTGYQWNGAINSCVIGYPTFTRSLTIGSTGTEVVNLKNLLAVKGLYTGYVSTAYDKDTATAVSLYQALHNISPTGTVGPLTRAALNKSVINGSY